MVPVSENDFRGRSWRDSVRRNRSLNPCTENKKSKKKLKMAKKNSANQTPPLTCSVELQIFLNLEAYGVC